MKIQTLAIYLSAVILLLASYFTSMEHSGRYLKYLIFPVVGISLLFDKQFVIKKFLLNNFTLYLSLIFCNFLVMIFRGQSNTRFFEEVFLLLIPILTVLVITGSKETDIRKTIDVFFTAYILSFIMFFWKELLDVVGLLSSFFEAFKLSEFPTESWLAFPLGLFSIYYFFEKRKIYFSVSFLFFLLTFKRIAIIAFFIAILVWFIYSKIVRIKFSPMGTLGYFVGLNIGFIGLIYLFISDFFTHFVKTHTGISINHFTQGRFVVYKDVINRFSEHLWTGSSLGSIHLYLENKYEDYHFLHSDIFKVLIELGIILFIVWLIFFIMINIKGKRSVFLILFLNILFISDNVFIYFDTLFVFYLIVSKYDNDISQKTVG